MSSTNKTPNYNLSQFTGTDKPAWLGDYNSDMSKIDTGIKSAADTATSAEGKADTATTNIGSLENLTTTNKTSSVAAINEVNTKAGTAENVANTAGNIANEAKSIATAIGNYLKITKFNTSTVTSSDGAPISGTIRSASNEDGTLGKIYGSIIINPVNTPTISITTNLRPKEQITINAGLLIQDSNNNEIYGYDMVIETTGIAKVTLSQYFNTHSLKLYFPPCVIFASNFGDQ